MTTEALRNALIPRVAKLNYSLKPFPWKPEHHLNYLLEDFESGDTKTTAATTVLARGFRLVSTTRLASSHGR